MNDLYGLYAPEPFLFDLVVKPVMKRRSKGGMVTKKKTKYSAELKQKALELLKSGETARQVCADLKIKYSTLLLWKRNAPGTAAQTNRRMASQKTKVTAEYVHALETELEMLKVYVEHLRNRLQISGYSSK